MSSEFEDWEEIAADDMGRALKGIGVNLLVKDVFRTLKFTETVLQMKTVRANKDFAVIVFKDAVMLIHPDHTYAENELLSLIPEFGARGAGAELRLYGLDAHAAERRAQENGYTVLRKTVSSPHGLQECFILDDDGYCWVPSLGVPTS